MKELVEQFALFGAVEEYNPLDEYPAEQFTEVYLIKFQRLQSARRRNDTNGLDRKSPLSHVERRGDVNQRNIIYTHRVAKRKLDENSFFGGILHVCYAPEFESVQETREKLQDRRRYVARATDDRGYEGKERRKDMSEKSGSVSASAESKFAATSMWGPAPQPDDFSPLQPYVTPEPHQEYSSPSVSETLPSGGTVRPPPCNRLQETSNPAQVLVRSSAARFMPRTAQLQERQRRREASLALSLSLSDSPEVVIGPKLPELPKLDLEDDSLNASAKLISEKLKEVSECSTVTKPEATSGDNTSAPPVKQRRRI
ncbi:unnamed protein product [Ranitomeya imitator]|uniref:RNA-binding protein 48 n=1 Tax=Ranitomeya imitator TaxID=111125 RepID=A0ABN9KYW8_9NEOB|nr:unnamed protein product [Ranitomeya imitator]